MIWEIDEGRNSHSNELGSSGPGIAIALGQCRGNALLLLGCREEIADFFGALTDNQRVLDGLSVRRKALRKQYGGVRFRVHGRRTVRRPVAVTVAAFRDHTIGPLSLG